MRSTLTLGAPAGVALLEEPASERGERTGRGHSSRIVHPERLSAGILVVLAALPIASYVYVAIHRIGYPYELEWMEGGSVEVVHRVVLGQSLYVPPSLHFTPWPYTPLYFWTAGAVSEVTGVGFLPLRLVSFGASLVVLWFLYRIVRDTTSDRVAGVVAAGLSAATFRLAGAWADIGRVDSLFLALTLWALDRSRRARTGRDGVVVGTLFFFSFFTKQDGLLVAAPVLVWLLAARRRAGVAASAMLAGLIATSTVVLDASTHGWYRYYVFDELRGQGFVRDEVLRFWGHDLLQPFTAVVFLVGVAAVVVLAGLRHRVDRMPAHAGYLVAAGAGLLGAAWVGRLHRGGYEDVLMPACAAAALGAGLAVAVLRRHGHGTARAAVSALLALVLALQLHGLAYDVGHQIPTRADARAGSQLLARLGQLPGQVLVFDHPFYGVLAGKGTVADGEAVGDVVRSGPSEARRTLVRSMRRALLAPGVGAVILDHQGEEHYFAAQLSSAYHLLPEPAVRGHAFYPVTDLRIRPKFVFVRNRLPGTEGRTHG